MNRRALLATLGAPVVAGLGQSCRTSSPKRQGQASTPERSVADERPSIFEKFHRSLLQVHGELRVSLGEILSAIENDSAATDDDIGGFCEELLDHHHAEDAFFFPAFRAARRLRSSDVAFLDARDAEHRDIHRLCLELRGVSRRHRRGGLDTRQWRDHVARASTELSTLSEPHFAVEESTLTGPHVATLITDAELAAVYRNMGKNWHRR